MRGPATCGLCERPFNSAGHLRQHSYTHHPGLIDRERSELVAAGTRIAAGGTA